MRNFLIVFLLAHAAHYECATTYKCNETSPCGCAPVVPILAKILGGEPSVAQSWPWIVSLRQPASNKDAHFCAAVILEASYVITAAHCVYGKMNMLSNITVCAGSDRLSDSCLQSRSVRQVIIHHGYKKKTHEHDMAIVQLDEPFDFTDRWISKICLPSAETESPYPPAGTSVLAIGWGKTERDNTASDKLQQVTLKVIDDSTSSCSNLLYNKEVQLCASGPNKNTCKGDSGGPLMQFTAENRWELVGITSYGNPKCTLPNRPGAYVRVSVYHNFIKSVIQNTYTPPVNRLYICECQCPYGTDSGLALTSTYSAESCIRACISISRNPCSSRNTYACLNSSCIYSSSYEHLTTNTTSELDLNLTSQSVFLWPNVDKYVGQSKDGKRHGRGTYYFSNGNNYTGDWFNSKRNGKGIMIWTDGKNYTGDWVDNMRTGQGVFTWPSGAKYEGQFQNDWRHGVGTYYFSNGNNYTGDWVNGSRTGQGLMNWSDGGKYIGGWFNDTRNGKGIFIDSDGDIYTGDWVDDMETGQGVFTWSSGDKYEGQFQNDWRHGVGTYYFSDGRKYVGDWIKGKMMGQGVMNWSDGKKYIGTWFKSGRNGKGSMIWPDGKNYTGGWINGMRTGQGVFTWPSGAKYEGQFEKDWIHGAGTYYFSDGDIYVGDWVEGNRTGQGVMTWYNRDKYAGDWIDDERNGKGIMTWSNGNRYMGDWKDDVRKGEGVMTWSDGDTYIGDWLDDMRTGYGIYKSSDGIQCQGQFIEGTFSEDSECNINMKL